MDWIGSQQGHGHSECLINLSHIYNWKRFGEVEEGKGEGGGGKVGRTIKVLG